LLTAAGHGIGRATALAFAAEGARVLATDVDRQALEALETPGGIETRMLDATSAEAIAELARTIEAPDVLFNCAGFVHHGTILECSEDDWAFSMELTLGC
jgi:2-keto-3-deoxy-L-fuconate dehydrogenase